MTIFELTTDFAVYALFTAFQLYKQMARIILRYLAFPFTENLVNKKLKGLGVSTDSKGKLGITIHDKVEFYLRIAIEGSLGLYEAHMDKVCTINDIKAVTYKVMTARKMGEMEHVLTRIIGLFNLQTRSKSWQVGKDHYDIGNEIFEGMLDKNLQYTCGYWKNATNLDEAQLGKMELIAQKLKLRPGMSVLDIGCGYGTLGIYLAKRYGVKYVGCSISKDQTNHGKRLSKDLDVEIKLCDYRDMSGQFDRVVSVGMFEHVGPQNHREFFEVCRRCLKDDGIFLLHTIGNNKSNYPVSGLEMWTHKHIFPNACVPYYTQLCKAMDDLWIIEDWHNFGFDYSKTVASREFNFDRAWNSEDGKLAAKYGERFYRMWKLFLNSAESLFKSRSLQLWQIVLSKDGLPRGYERPTL